MTEKPEWDLKDEFKDFGANLKKAFEAAWDSEERMNAQQDIEAGINQLGQALNKFASTFNESEAGKQFVDEVDEIGQRLRSGEVAEKARQELIKVLKTINAELEKTSQKYSADKD